MYLRHSTANQHISLGEFLDSTDGNTAETTGISVLSSDIKLHKWGTQTIANKNSGGASIFGGTRWGATLDGVDTNTLGNLDFTIHPTGALLNRVQRVVLPTTVFDALVASGAMLPVDVRAWRGSTVNALIAGRVDSNSGAAQTALQAIATSVASAAVAAIQLGLAPSSQTSTIDARLSSTLNANVTVWRGSTVNELISGKVDANATVSINSVVLADVARWRGVTVLAPNVAGVPISDPNYWRGSVVNELIAGQMDSAASVSGNVTVSSILAGVITGPAFTAGGITAIQDGLATRSQLASTISATVAQWRGSSVNALIAGRVDVNVGVSQTALLATASSVSSAAVASIQLGLAPASQTSIIDARLSSTINVTVSSVLAGAISQIQSGIATTSQVASTLTATVSGTVTAIVPSTVNANVSKINNVTVTGTGAAGSEWGP